MAKLKAEWPKYLLGLVFVATALFGGGAASGIWTDTAIQIAIVLVAAPVLAAGVGESIDVRVKWLCGLILVAIAIQLVPLPEFLIRSLRGDILAGNGVEPGSSSIGFISLGLGRTLGALLYVAVLILLLLALLRLPGQQLHALLPFFLAGVACNALAGFIQYSSSEILRIDSLPYTITAGFFANRNHFVSLLYTALPFLLYLSTFARVRLWSILSIIVILLVILAAGSRAGAVLGLAGLIFSILFFASRSRGGIGSLVIVAVMLGVYAMGTWLLIDRHDLTDASRGEFAATTFEGIKDNWLFGIGYGNFPAAYQVYQDPSTIFRSYVNHAHNDYLEIALEGGIGAAILIVAYLVVVVLQIMRMRHSHFHKAAFLSIMFVLIHSFVDYPLRTMAVAVAFVYFHAILFHHALRPAGRYIKGIIEVSEGKRRRRIPVTAENK